MSSPVDPLECMGVWYVQRQIPALAFLEAALRSEWARESHPLEQLWHRVGVPHAIERVDIRQ